MRKIIHIDMDAFYASVEQRDNPALRGKPVAVARDASRCVVTTASYEARRYGVRSALSVATAKRLCPRLIFVPPRFDVYKRVSAQIREIFRRYTDLVEPLSLDEAYLDVTRSPSGKTATQIAREIRAAIRSELGLTASAGVSFNKFLAKVASDLRKPDGLSRILPKDAPAFIDALPVESFFGVGPGNYGLYLGQDAGYVPTNVSLELLATLGIGGFVAFYGLTAALAVQAFVLYRRRQTEQTFLLFSFALALLFFTVILQINQGYLRLYHWMMFGILWGAIGREREEECPESMEDTNE